MGNLPFARAWVIFERIDMFIALTSKFHNHLRYMISPHSKRDIVPYPIYTPHFTHHTGRKKVAPTDRFHLL